MTAQDHFAEVKDQFDLLFRTLCALQTGILDNTARAAGFLLLATGWIATSVSARDFLKAQSDAKYIAIAAIMGTFACFALAGIKLWRDSKRTSARLDQLGFMPREFYEPVIIDTPLFWLTIATVFFLALLPSYLIWSLH